MKRTGFYFVYWPLQPGQRSRKRSNWRMTAAEATKHPGATLDEASVEYRDLCETPEEQAAHDARNMTDSWLNRPGRL